MPGWAPPGWLQKWGTDNGLAAVAVEPAAKTTATAEAAKPTPRKTAWADDEPIGPRVERDEPPVEAVDLPPAGWAGRSWTNRAAIRRGENIDGILHGAYPDGSLAEALAEAAAHNRMVYERRRSCPSQRPALKPASAPARSAADPIAFTS